MKGKWVTKTITELSETMSGGTPSRNTPEYFIGNIKWFTTSELNDSVLLDSHEHISMMALSKSAAKSIPAGTILLAMYGATIGKLGILSTEATCNQACCAIICKAIDTKYLFYYLLNDRDKLVSLGCGAGQPNISQEIVKKYHVFYPVFLPDQQHIADILTSCDEVIEQTEKAIEKYRAIKAGMLQDLFTRGVDANGKLRPKPEDAPELYKDSPLGKIPKEWEIMPFSQCFELRKNNTLSREFLSDQPGKIYNIHYGDVLIKYPSCVDCLKNDIPSLRLDKMLSFSEDFAKEGDVIFADTAEDDTVGKAVELINVGTLKIVSGLHTIFCHPIINCFASCWLGYFVNSDIFHKQLLPYVVGSKVSSISRENIKKTYILHPGSEEQKNIVNKFISLDYDITTEEKLLAKYRSIKQGLMKKLLTPPEGALEA